jgi:hypothetical protein
MKTGPSKHVSPQRAKGKGEVTVPDDKTETSSSSDEDNAEPEEEQIIPPKKARGRP